MKRSTKKKFKRYTVAYHAKGDKIFGNDVLNVKLVRAKTAVEARAKFKKSHKTARILEVRLEGSEMR